MVKKKLLSGIQPTNSLTIGNYLGSIKKIVDLQDQYETILFVADLHARTIPLVYHKFNFEKLEEYKWNLLKMYCACGVNFSKTKIFFQSSIPEHLELFYFLLTHSTLGELRMMTQYKNLSQKLREPNGTEMALMGLLCYPVLMAADILLYDVDLIAVGKDQEQHIELTSRIAKRINEKYSTNIFKIPEVLKIDKSSNSNDFEELEKIMDLQDPTKKMSKTNDNADGVIFLTDDEETARKKIMKAKTDSFNKINLHKETQPGVFNLLSIYAAINKMDINKSYQIFQDANYLELKKKVADSVCLLLKTITDAYKNINSLLIKEQLDFNTEYCSKIAKFKLKQIYAIL